MMTNTKPHQAKTVYKTAKKADPFVTLKSSIMLVSIAGTMAGWLVLLNQGTDNPPVNSDTLNTAVFDNNTMAMSANPVVDISQLRQVNEVAPIEAIRVVARTRSSQ